MARPPADVIRSDVGDILIVAQPQRQEVEAKAAPIIASRAVLQKLQAGPPVANASSSKKKRGAIASPGEDRPVMVEKVAKEVLGKLWQTPAFSRWHWQPVQANGRLPPE